MMFYRIISVGLASISSFLVSVIAPAFVVNEMVASEYVKTYSLALMVSNYLTHLLLFRDANRKTINIDVAFIFTVLAALFFMGYVDKEYVIFGVSAAIVLFLSGLYRIAGHPTNGKKLHTRKLVVILILVLAIMGSLLFEMKLNFLDSVVLSSFVMIPMLVVLVFSIDFKSIRFSLISNLQNYILLMAAEILPMVAGFIINVHTLKLMDSNQYLIFKGWYAFVGLSSLVGALSVVAICEIKKLIRTASESLIYIILTLIAIVWFGRDSVQIISFTLLLIFSLGALLNAYGKAYLNKRLYFLSNLMPAAAISIYVLLSRGLNALEILLALAIVQSVYVFGMVILIKFKK